MHCRESMRDIDVRRGAFWIERDGLFHLLDSQVDLVHSDVERSESKPRSREPGIFFDGASHRVRGGRKVAHLPGLIALRKKFESLLIGGVLGRSVVLGAKWDIGGFGVSHGLREGAVL